MIRLEVLFDVYLKACSFLQRTEMTVFLCWETGTAGLQEVVWSISLVLWHLCMSCKVCSLATPMKKMYTMTKLNKEQATDIPISAFWKLVC